MLHGHSHGHGDHDGDDHHGHFHAHISEDGGSVGGRFRFAVRLMLALVLLAGAGLAASAVMVGAGQAVVIARFGDPLRVLTEPGLAWKIPAPLENAIAVDLRLRTTSTGLQDVGTRDGLRILVQAYAVWQVPSDPASIRQFLRAVRNDPDEAARQLRSLIGSALQVTASSFELADLVNTDPDRARLGAFESRLRDQIARQVLDTYGIAIRQTGIERLSLPETTLAATVGRMRSERETVAARRTTEGLRAAALIRSEAARDARIAIAHARTEAAEIEAASRREAAATNAKAYAVDSDLYLMLRSLDTLATVVGANTRLVLRTDAAPFNMLVLGPRAPAAVAGPGIASGSGIAASGPGIATSGIAPSGIAPSGIAPSGIAPSGIAPSGIAPSGIAPSGIAPSGIAPSGIAPSGIAPSGIAPSGIAPSGIAPSGIAPSGIGPSGIAPSGIAPSGIATPVPGSATSGTGNAMSNQGAGPRTGLGGGAAEGPGGLADAGPRR